MTKKPQKTVSVSFELFPPRTAKGVEGFHVYTLDKPEVSLAICRAPGLPAVEGQRDAA